MYACVNVRKMSNIRGSLNVNKNRNKFATILSEREQRDVSKVLESVLYPV